LVSSKLQRCFVTRALSIWLPFLAIDRVRRQGRGGERADPKAPFAVWAAEGAARRIVVVGAAARARGLESGMTVAVARAMLPDLVLLEADPGADAACLDAVLAWSRRFTPLAARDRPDGLMLDVAGAAHLFGGEAPLLREVEQRLAAQGFHARAALADSPELAHALARWGARPVAPAGLDEKALMRFAAPLPLAALRLSEGQIAGLAQAGLRRIGDVLHRPRAPIAARWGRGLFEQLDAMLGRAKSAIDPVFEAPAYLAERKFAEPIARREDVEAVIASLARELCALLERHGEGLRRVEASFFRVDGVVKSLQAGASRPLREPAVVARLFRERLESLGEEGLDAGWGFDLARLSALEVDRLEARQSALAPADAPTAVEARENFDDLVDRLSARLGARRVQRLSPHASHIPEHAVVAAPYGARPATAPRSAASRSAAGWSDAALLQSSSGDEDAPTRPLRLLDRPERIETVAAVPDGPPLRFRWRRAMHEVAAVEGPERIAPEWWRGAEDDLTRDYFRVEDARGRRFWLYRRGLYERETTRPEWFLHGFFG
jgi:protein ImuB